MAHLKILLIEDEAAVAKLLAHAVRAEGHEVVVTTSPRKGLELLQLEPFDGVFLDIVMPQLNGIEVLRQIRSFSHNLPVVVITGFATDAQREEAERLGVSGVVEKPLSLTHLSFALGSLRPTRAAPDEPSTADS